MSSQNTYFSFDTAKVDIKPLEFNQRAFGDSSVYSVVPVFSKGKRPDIYLGNKQLRAIDYRNKDIISYEHQTAESSPNTEKNEEKIEDVHCTYDDLKNEKRRYFTKENITIKCFNCGEVGHLAKYCTIAKIIKCIRCNEVGHEEHDCLQVKCFKCNQLGHRSYECKATKENIIQCFRCNNLGHISTDCLINPKQEYRSNNKLRCAFCHSKKHFICPFPTDEFRIEDYNSEEVDISNDDESDSLNELEESSVYSNQDDGANLGMKKARKKIFPEIPNEHIHKLIFCYKCGDIHSSKNCLLKQRENIFDMRRLHFSIKNNDHSNNYNPKKKHKSIDSLIVKKNNQSYNKLKGKDKRKDLDYNDIYLETPPYEEKKKKSKNNKKPKQNYSKGRYSTKRESNEMMFNRLV